MQGVIQAVQTTPGGGYPLADTAIGGTTLTFSDAAPFDTDGGTLEIEGVQLEYTEVDYDLDIVTLAAPLTFAVLDQDFVYTVPATESVTAVVALGDDIIEDVEVSHEHKAMLEEGPRDPGEGEAVTLEMTSLGTYRIKTIEGREASIYAGYIEDAEELLMADQITLGQKLADAAAERGAAAGRLAEAEQRLNDAFDEIEILPDSAYVEAAKQQAIDAAAITAQQKADAAKAAAIADAQGKLAAARTALETAISDGDADAIADAEQKVLAAKQQAIAAAAADATTKANQAKADAIAAASSDATAKAAEAMSKATAALTAAESAQATADNAIRTYYSSEPPWANGSAQPDDVLGDMWYDNDDGQAYRWNGTSWGVIRDQGIGEALSAAQDAQTTADGKITAFYQPNEPLAGDEGDLWFDIDNGNRVYRRTSSAWVDVADARIAAQATALANVQQDITGLEGTLDGKSNIWVQSTQPSGMTAADKGDIWINDGATPRTTKVWNGTAWIDADSRITQAVADVATKITTYYTATTTAPTGTFVNGDLWIDINGKIARRNGSSWVTVSDPKALADAAKTAAISAAATDATNKANAAETAAKTAASADATSKAATAEANAKAAAATDAQAKADAAKAAAEAAAKAYADTVSSGASGDALAAAKADATAKANAAEAAAKAAAAADATSKAAAAEAAAKAAAALDATAKANQAETNAKNAASAALAPVQTRLTTAEGLIDKKAVIHYQPAAPTGLGAADAGDIWIDSDAVPKTYKSWSGAAWVDVTDQPSLDTLAKVNTKITTFVTTGTAAPGAPSGGFVTGDLWVDINGKIARRNGSSWVTVSDPKALSDAAKAAAIAAAALDATAKADAAREAAKTAAAADATAKSEAAEAAAAATAAADATTKANQAKADAEAAAKTYADTVSSGASGDALAAAKADATAKADAAREAAKAAAALDATAKAEAAQAEAARLAALDATAKANAAQAAAEAAAAAVENRALSRGTDLVTNGTGYLKNNYNFAPWTYDPTDAPTGISGSFVIKSSARPSTWFSTEAIPIDPSKQYVLSTFAREQTDGVASRTYFGIAPLDIMGGAISPNMYAHNGATTTTLAKPLNPGDTTVTLTSAAGWTTTAPRTYIGIWNYTDPKGKTWPVGTYTRLSYTYTAINGNVLTLTSAYAGPAQPAGTSVSNMTAGGSYMYTTMGNTLLTNAWTKYTSPLIGGVIDASNWGIAVNSFPPGTAQIKLLALPNYTGASGSSQAYAGISFSDAAAAQAKADAVAASLVTVQSNLTGLEGKVDGKANIFVQATAPTGLVAADKGDIWINNGVTPRIVQVWTGSAWVEADSRTTQAVADIAKKTTTFTTANTTAPAAPAGGFTAGDLWLDVNGKIARWSGSAWVTAVDPKALANAAEQAAKTAAAADATSKAATAEANAKAAAATDAQTKANAAKTAAEAAAKTYSDTVASGAQQAAIDAAKADATTKADAAREAAKTAAAADATSKAAAAEAAAKTAAATDAKTKADAALAAAKVYADNAASQAETNAKAFATTRTDGLAKTLWSTALPGTTTAPQNSVWYREDGAGKIIAVFTQTAAGSAGNTWSARPITSEAIDNLDVGKLTAAQGTINDLVANTFAAKLASIIKADIGNLTVTGASNLNEVVAERIWGNIASFARITADQVLAGNIQAVWSITSDGKIVAGDPLGRAAELDEEGLVLWDVVDSEEGGRRISTRLGGDGADELALLDEDGNIIGGIDSEGVVTGTALQIDGEAVVGGTPLLGTLLDPAAEPGWLDQLPWGIVAKLTATSQRTARGVNEDWGYVILPFTALPYRMYRVTVDAEVLAGTAGKSVRGYIREKTGGSPAKVSDAWVSYSTTGAGVSGQTMALRVTYVGFYTAETDVSMLFSMLGIGTGHTPYSAYMQVEDIGPYIPNSGSYSTGGAVPASGGTPDPEPVVTKKYVSTWKASDSQAYIESGSKRTSPDIVQGQSPYFAAGGHQRSAIIFNSTAFKGEVGVTIPNALKAGSTLEKAEVYLYFDHWHYGSGGTALLGSLGSATIPSNGSGISYSKAVSGWARGQGRWVTIPTSWISATKRGITIGGGSNSSPLFYGRADGANESRKPQLRLTYTR